MNGLTNDCSVKEIAYLVGMSQSAIRTYLGHYSFNKFRKGRDFKINKAFFETLSQYLQTKKRYKNIKRIEKIKGKV